MVLKKYYDKEGDRMLSPVNTEQMRESNVIDISHLLKKERPVIRQTADPIKDKGVIKDIEEYLIHHGRYGYRNWLIFCTGLNIGRRCSDLLKLRIKDVFDGEKVVDTFSYIKESKTGKVAGIYLNPLLQKAIYNYIQSLPYFDLEDYLFKSQKGGCLTRKSYWRILHQVCEELNLGFRLSTHSMRKSWAYNLYQEYKGVTFQGGFDIVDQLQYMLNHSSRAITLRYIGIQQEDVQKLYKDNVLGLSYIP